MSSRRSPSVATTTRSVDDSIYKSSNSSSSSNISSSSTRCRSSPSRTEKTYIKRSLLEQGRLCLIRQRGRTLLFYKRCFVIMAVLFVSTYALISRLQLPKHPLQQTLRQRKQQQSTTENAEHHFDYFDFHSDRILAQKISNNIHTKWRPDSRPVHEVFYAPKPRMMGFIVRESASEMQQQQQPRRHNVMHKDPSQIRHYIDANQYDTVQFNYQDPSVQNIYRFDNIQPYTIQNIPFGSSRIVQVPELGNGNEAQQDIKHNSKDYDRGKPDDPPDGCQPQYEWQELSFPNCNALHELDLAGKVFTDVMVDDDNPEPEGFLLASGGYRDTWFVEQNHVVSERIALKTLLYEHPFTERNMDRHRRDALATDRLTGSPYALNLYGYCANSGLYEFADGGSLEDAVDDEEEYQSWNASIKFKHAYQVAQAIADVHNIDKEGFPSMSHTDISMSQFVSTNGGIDFQINDFNRARFLYHKIDNPNELCPFEVGSNKGKFRSPEEYAYKPETAKIDVYSMGNIFYVLLTGKYPFEAMEKKEAMKAVKKGRRPIIPDQYLNSQDPYEQAMVEAIKRCWVQDPEKRATSREIERYLSMVRKQQ